MTMVVDPSLPATAQGRLLRKIRRSGSEADTWVLAVSFVLCIISPIVLTILHFVIGLSWWWMLATIGPAAVLLDHKG